ncbi:MAG: hypothetical protein RJA44_1246 [Pseudomonadota bacterium]
MHPQRCTPVSPGTVLWWLVTGLMLLALQWQQARAAEATPADTAASAGAAASAASAPGLSGAAKLADARQRLNRGTDLAAQQQIAAAMAVFRNLISDYPDLAEAHNNLGVLQAAEGRHAEARASFENALRTSSSHAAAYDNLNRLATLQASKGYARPLSLRPDQPGLTLLNEIALSGWASPPPAAAAPAASAPATAASGNSTGVQQASAGLTWWGRLMQTDQPPAAQGGERGSISLHTFALLLLAMVTATVLLFATAQGRAFVRGPRDETGTSILPSSRSISPAPAAPEARLIEIYRLIGVMRNREALARTESLINEMPNFHLAQLIYGDLLIADSPLPEDGAGQGGMSIPGNGAVTPEQLQLDASRRLQALQLKPPGGAVPSAFVHLASNIHHAIAIDTAHSRLYLFENRSSGPVSIASYYVALGRSGNDKERDNAQATPFGVYFVTGRLDMRELDDFYGAGALPLNYPNEHDRLLGRNGSDIWLHGVPSDQYARPTGANSGAIVLANDDLRRLWRDLAPLHTPVVITRELDWVDASSQAPLRKELLAVVDAWRQARSVADIQRTLGFYGPEFRLRDANPVESRRNIERELLSSGPREREVRDISLLAWDEEGARVVVNFTEHVKGTRGGTSRRQYWSRDGGQWKIYLEGSVE